MSILTWLSHSRRQDVMNELQAWANTVRNPATSFTCEELADGIEATLEKLK